MIKTFIIDITKGFIVDVLVKLFLFLAFIGGLWYSYNWTIDYYLATKKEQVLKTIKTELNTEKIKQFIDSNKTKAVISTTKTTASDWFKSVKTTIKGETP